MVSTMSYLDIIDTVSKKVDLPPDKVDKIYKSFWKYIKVTIKELPLKQDLSKEEFSKLRTNFNIPSLGKFSCTYDRMLGVKKRYKIIKEIRKNDKH